MAIKLKLKPLGGRVIVEPIEQEEMTPGGIILPETAKEKPQEGKVLAALGPRDPSYCPRAIKTIAQVRASGYESNRPDITTNITAAELECSPSAPGNTSASPTAVSAPTKILSTSTPYPTNTPSP